MSRRRSRPRLPLVGLLCASLGAGAQDGEQAARVEAALVFNVLKFVEFPQREGNLRLCLLNDQQAANRLLLTQRGATLNGRTLEVESLAGLDGLEACWAVYLGSADQALRDPLLRRARGGAMLTVGDVERFAELGGIVGIYEEDNRLRLKINLDSAKRAGLVISARMLSLATIVREDAP